MKKIRDEAAPPPGGEYIYVNIEDGVEIRHSQVEVCQRRAKEYRLLNNYPIGSNWQQDFIDNVCSHGRPFTCIDSEPPSVTTRLAAFATAIARWAKQGLPTRTPEEVDGILSTCRACTEYGGETGVLKIICGKCGCSRVKVAMSTEHCPLNPPKW